MAENILKKLVNNSQIAIDDGVYDVDVNLKKSDQDFKQIISLDQRSKNSLWTFVKLVFEFNNNSGFGFIKFHSIYL